MIPRPILDWGLHTTPLRTHGRMPIPHQPEHHLVNDHLWPRAAWRLLCDQGWKQMFAGLWWNDIFRPNWAARPPIG